MEQELVNPERYSSRHWRLNAKQKANVLLNTVAKLAIFLIDLAFFGFLSSFYFLAVFLLKMTSFLFDFLNDGFIFESRS